MCVRLEGFEITGFWDDGVYGKRSDLEIVGNWIHHIGRICTEMGSGLNGIFISDQRVLIEGNRIHDIGRLAGGEAGCDTSPATTNNDHGIYLANAHFLTIRRNVFFNHQRGWPIPIYNGSGNGSSNIQILHNTFAFEHPTYDGHIYLAKPWVRDTVVANNIFYDPRKMAIRYQNKATFSHVQIQHNLVFDAPMTTTNPSGTRLSGNLSGNPFFVHVAGGDFRLCEGPGVPHASCPGRSPAIDAGEDLGLPCNGLAPDLGALESGGETLLPGDVSGDGEVTLADLVLQITMLAGFIPATPGADLNGDGEQTVADARALIHILVAP